MDRPIPSHFQGWRWGRREVQFWRRANKAMRAGSVLETDATQVLLLPGVADALPLRATPLGDG